MINTPNARLRPMTAPGPATVKAKPAKADQGMLDNVCYVNFPCKSAHLSDDNDIQEIFETTEILDGRAVIEPARSYAWVGVV